MTITPKPKIRLLHSLPRSGGTLLSRCLGCMDDIILLSEIHPYGLKWNNPLGQANEWFKLFTAQEIEAITKTGISFIDSIKLIHEKCNERGKTLIIRDWSHLDYFGKPFIPAPSFHSTLVRKLKDHFDIIQTSLIRHPIDLWLSLRHLTIMQDQLSINEYLLGYLRFSEFVQKSGFIKFETFTEEPDQQLSRLCENLRVNFDISYKDKWYDFSHVSGARGNIKENHRVIRPLGRLEKSDDVLSLFSNNDHYQRALRLLDYKNV